jgi:ubiquinone/menaquinone biosynthesis C-methylase UbiE
MSEAPNLFSDGKTYERLMGRWSQLAGKTFLDWLALPKGLRWLDVGCGNGAFTEILIAQNAPATVTGVDPSEGQIAYARTRPGAKAAEFRVAGAQELPFADHSFDAAIMALVISFVPDPLKAAAEMRRVVRPGGTVATYMWDVPGGGLPHEPAHRAMHELGLELPVPPGSEASREANLRTVWQKAGLEVVETRVIRIRVAFANFDDFWDSTAVPIGPAGIAITKLSADQKEQLKRVLRRLLSADKEGRIGYEAFANAVKGKVPA